MSVAITGANGFVGKFLLKALAQDKIQAFCFSRSTPPTTRENEIWALGDIREVRDIEEFLGFAGAKTVFHLAGVKKSQNRTDFDEINVNGTRNLLDAAKKVSPDAKLIIVGSSAQYGEGSEDHAITEDSELSPENPYGESKVRADQLARRYFEDFGMNTVRVRAFNLFGPGQDDQMLCANVAKQLESDRTTLELGDLSHYRDFVDVRDLVTALLCLSASSEAGEVYNVCTGQATLCRDAVDMMVRIRSKMGELQEIQINETKFPGSKPIHYQRGSFEKIRRQSGWEPKFSLEQSLTDILKESL